MTKRPDLDGKRLLGQIEGNDDSIRIGKGRAGIERIAAHIGGKGFSPHRHDTYAIGLTLSGIQTFRYRGARRYCASGQCHVLYPDETHDGVGESTTGFSYRIVYVAPSILQAALGGAPLPFVADPVVDAGRGCEALLRRLWNVDDDLEDIEDDEIAWSVLSFLETCSENSRPTLRRAVPWEGLSRVRELLSARSTRRCTSELLEKVSGLDRWTLAREFRAAYGTSPRGFRTMRQLDTVRSLLLRGVAPADAAVQVGFSDQSHMSRMFKRAYGLTPMQWTSAVTHAGKGAVPHHRRPQR